MIKKVKELTCGETERICDKSDGCANCPLLISSYNREIHCLRDDKVEIWEVKEFYELMQKSINLDTFEIVENEEEQK